MEVEVEKIGRQDMGSRGEKSRRGEERRKKGVETRPSFCIIASGLIESCPGALISSERSFASGASFVLLVCFK